jgi:hypothetical protein
MWDEKWDFLNGNPRVQVRFGMPTCTIRLVNNGLAAMTYTGPYTYLPRASKRDPNNAGRALYRYRIKIL